MRKCYKVLSLAVGISMMVSLFSGCKTSQGNPENVGTITKEELDPAKIGDYGSLKLPLTDKATKLTMISDTNMVDLDSAEVMKELRRRTGVDLEIIEIPRSTIQEKAKVLMASKDEMPDIFSGGMPITDINIYGASGGFEPIDEHLEELPNFKNIFVTNAETNKTGNIFKKYAAPDGHLYIFPSFDSERDVNHGMLYRKDIFDKHNIPMWNSPDEYYQTLKKLKSLYPNSTPMVSKTQINFFNQMSQSWGIWFPQPYYDEDSKVWKHSLDDPKFKDMLDYIKKLYDEGLLDNEFMTATAASWTSKMTQKEAAFTTFDWIGRLDMFKEQTATTVPEYDLRYGNPIGPTGKVVTLPKVGGGPAIKKSDNSILAMQVLDYLISPSGAQLMTLGIEGKTYSLGEDGFADYINMDNSKPISINDLESKYGMFASGVYRRFDKRSTYFNYSQREKEAQDLMLNKPNGGFLPEDPGVILTTEEKSAEADYATKLQKAAEEFATKYVISNETGDNAWNSWLMKAKSLGTDKVVEIYNTAQKRYDAN